MNAGLTFGADESKARVTCLVVHGRGQTPDDMVRMIVSHLDAPGVRFILPKSEGVGWYAARAIDPLTDETRAAVSASVNRVALAMAGISGPVVLVGFSQGACLGAELMFRHGAEGIAAACLFTGCWVGTGADDRPSAALTGLPVYVSGGDADPWIPAGAFHDLLDDLTRAGARVRGDLFPGRPHAVTRTEIAMLQQMLDRVAEGQAVFGGDADVFD